MQVLASVSSASPSAVKLCAQDHVWLRHLCVISSISQSDRCMPRVELSKCDVYLQPCFMASQICVQLLLSAPQ
eukprot:3499737-Pleurochrysis_carterae.AAC.2